MRQGMGRMEGEEAPSKPTGLRQRATHPEGEVARRQPAVMTPPRSGLARGSARKTRSTTAADSADSSDDFFSPFYYQSHNRCIWQENKIKLRIFKFQPLSNKKVVYFSPYFSCFASHSFYL